MTQAEGLPLLLETSIPPTNSAARGSALVNISARIRATPEGRAELLHSIYERIVVRGPVFVSARLTPEAYSLGLALALPERVQPAQAGSTGAPDRSQAWGRHHIGQGPDRAAAVVIAGSQGLCNAYGL